MSNKQRSMIDYLRDAGVDAFTNSDGTVTAIELAQDARGVIYDREVTLRTFADLRAFCA